MVLSNQDINYKQCSLSVMDNIADPNITFDENGICNYYYEYLDAEKKFTLTGDEATKKVSDLVAEMKAHGKGKKYDCMLGVSGGVDSTYLALKAKQYGLRVLCVHFDNGWNSELAVKNIENIVTKCGFDLYTYVIDWNEFKDIQLAYLKANVIDIEAVTDIAVFASLDKICTENKLKYIIDGRNVWTEETLPKSWIFKDTENLIDIHANFGKIPLKSYPILGKLRRAYIQFQKPFHNIKLLNYLHYDKRLAKEEIVKELGWRDYGGKHYESIFTRFYQGYILPEKFKVDKRKAHLSNLIFAGQITKEEALEELKKPIYHQEQMEIDKEFVLKKLRYSEKEFDAYIKSKPVPHANYAVTGSLIKDYPLLKLIKPIYKKLKGLK
jgi:N-acetyl sugar amidotransferase